MALYENSLLRSMLAFAGADHPESTAQGEDGILTALDVTEMDLSGTELVVLSACSAASGDIWVSEGVFGLRRAFKIAGAKNLLTTLWEVDDEITADLMKRFYIYWVKDRLPLAAALRQAQRDTIKDLENTYGGIAPPEFWAAFVLQGAQALAP
jgi:CHAT domain-containing protein